jgi:cytochrome c biogenesis protein
MSSSEVKSDLSPLNQLWKTFASVKLTIGLLLTLAATSIIGTLIPQNETPVAYVQAFGEFLYRLFALLGLFGLQATWKILFVRHPRFNIARYRQFKNKVDYKYDGDADQLKNYYPPVISRSFRYHRLEDTDDGFAIYGERGRWTRLGVYVVHSSVVLLLIGGLIGSIFGFDGFVNIPEGESVRSIQLTNSNQKMPLPFEVRCDDFNVDFYDSGTPKEFRSRLTILKQGKAVVQKDQLREHDAQ